VTACFTVHVKVSVNVTPPVHETVSVIVILPVHIIQYMCM
jgi:hypothetical protein